MSLNDRKKLLSNTEKNRKIKEIKRKELNKECFDCGSSFPEYISINNGIFICKNCLNFHNKLPKQISTTLKNNLPSLNSKELEFMFLGGNDRLFEFVNYEYPQLHKFKINILYQTKAMQYYRNNLHYMVYGGPKPVKPNEKINAYEIVNADEFIVKNEKIKKQSYKNNKVNKVNNNKSLKEKKRNKSVGRLDHLQKINENKEKTLNVEKNEEKRNKIFNNRKSSLKRHKSFYREMYKLFGVELNNDINSITEDNNINKNKNDDLEINEDKNKFKYHTNENNINSKFEKYPIEHNNNYFTLSATRNFFMYTPNKNSMIFKHRKMNDDIYEQNYNPEFNKTREIYYKPKIPYIITSNKKKINNNLYFSIKDNLRKELNLKNENEDNEKNISNIIPNNSNINIKSMNTYFIKKPKNNKNTASEDMNKNNKSSKDVSDIRYNERNRANINDIKAKNENKKIIKEKIINTIDKDERKKYKNENINNFDKEKNFIILRNNNKISNYHTIDIEYHNNKPKKELKEIKEKIIKAISNKFYNEKDTNNKNTKYKTYLINIGEKRKDGYHNNKENNVNSKKEEKGSKYPASIEEKKDEEAKIKNNFQKKEIINEYGLGRESKNDKYNNYENENNKIKSNENKESEINETRKAFLEKRRRRAAKYYEQKNNIGKEKILKIEIYNDKIKEKRLKNDDKIEKELKLKIENNNEKEFKKENERIKKEEEKKELQTNKQESLKLNKNTNKYFPYNIKNNDFYASKPENNDDKEISKKEVNEPKFYSIRNKYKIKNQ